MDRIIVSRHPATVEFIARELGGELRVSPNGSLAGLPCTHTVRVRLTEAQKQGEYAWRKDWNDVPDAYLIRVLASATPDDVRGKVVYGNLPLHLAALTSEVHAVEFSGTPPRGAEYSLADMDAAGARLACYRVEVAPFRRTFQHAQGCGLPEVGSHYYDGGIVEVVYQPTDCMNGEVVVRYDR